ncbi:hypothetical protein ES707_22205 [subsurface metagenome]
MTALSGGRVSGRDHDRPCARTGSAFTPPRFPTPLPPYSTASLLSTSFQNPPNGTPTR